MYGLTLRSAIAVWLKVSCSIAHASSVAVRRIDTGASVADQWIWKNASGGEVLTKFTQIISTCLDQNSGSLSYLKRSLAIIFMPTPGTLARTGVSLLARGGGLFACDAVVNNGIWPQQPTGQGDSA